MNNIHTFCTWPIQNIDMPFNYLYYLDMTLDFNLCFYHILIILLFGLQVIVYRGIFELNLLFNLCGVVEREQSPTLQIK